MSTEPTTAVEIQVAPAVLAKISEKADIYAHQAKITRNSLSIALLAEQSPRAHTMADLLNKIAASEAASNVFRGAADMLSRGRSAADLWFLTERVLAGPDDGWSGRTNDVRRAEFEGMREGVKDLRWILPLTHGQD